MPRLLQQCLRARSLLMAVLLLFVVAGVVRFRNETGEDLSSSYVGCRLVATGNTGVLYAYDLDNFADVGDLTGTWQRLGTAGGFHGYLHPYVQTPLWAYMLQPLCNRMKFKPFEMIFLVLTLLVMAASVWMVARYWTPWLYGAVPIAIVLLCLWYSQPFQYAMFLMQTHALFFFLTIAALILAEKEHEIPAGFLMACAAAVKLTPAVMVVYWLLTRRWKAAASLVLSSGLLMLLSYMAVGPQVMAAYLADLHRVSRVLLVAQNNQSFAAWVMARFYSPDEVFDITILRLPAVVRIGSTVLMLACTIGGGLLDGWRRERARVEDRRPAPMGAMIALIAMTIFAPIAWTHYSIILVAPVMVLVQESRNLRSWWMAALVFAILALNYRPLATDVLHMDIGDYSIIRGQFFAGVLCMMGLATAGWMSRRRVPEAVCASVLTVG